MTNIRSLFLAAFVAGVAPLASACYVEPGPVGVGVEYGYEPVYYDGAMVYYDDGGRPFYYANGAAVFIAPGSPRYGFYVNHWRRYRTNYRHWYTHRGYRYRTYRSPAVRHEVRHEVRRDERRHR